MMQKQHKIIDPEEKSNINHNQHTNKNKMSIKEVYSVSTL